MNAEEVLEFIKQKNELINNDFKILFLFETKYIPENKERYGKKLVALEQKIAVDETNPKKMRNFLNTAYENGWKGDHKKCKIIKLIILIKFFFNVIFYIQQVSKL